MSKFFKLHVDLISSFFQAGSSNKDDSKEKLVEEKELEIEDWTDKDTTDLIDIMETALNKVKKGLSRKLGKLGGKRNSSQSIETISSVDSLETFVNDAQTKTVHVVSEINKGMDDVEVIIHKMNFSYESHG